MATETESDLIVKATAGSEEAFTDLVAMHQGAVRAYLGQFCRAPDLADDMAQEVFLAAYRSMSSYRGQSRFRAWLLGIARHRALWLMREERRRRLHEKTLEVDLMAWRVERAETSSLDDARIESELSALEKCIGELPEHSAKLVRAFYGNSSSYAELSQEHGKGKGALRMTLLRIRQALRTCIRKRMALQGGTA